MKAFMSRLGILFIAIAIVALFAACGEDVVEGNNAGNGGETNQNQIDNNDEDCGPDEQLNPLTGECNPITGENQTQNQTDNQSQNQTQNQTDNQSQNQTQNQTDNQSQNQTNPNGDPGCGFGTIHGQACATDGNKLPAATVTVAGVDCHGDSFQVQTSTNGEGVFYLDNVPAGHHQLFVTSGSFSSDRPVTVFGGQETNLLSEADKVCVDGDVEIMVFTGSWDDIPSLLDGLGLNYESRNGAQNVAYLLNDPTELAQYDIIFFECAFTFSSLSDFGDVSEMMDNLRYFVQQGNSIYASDRAHRYIDDAFPNVANFPTSGFGPTGTQTVNVVSTSMQLLLGGNTAQITFDTGWQRMDSAGMETQVHFTGLYDGADTPLMVSYSEPINGGTVVYTSFHNIDNTSPDMDDILNFIIFQL